MLDINGLQIGINKSWYNKTKLQDDGVTQIIDTTKQYPMYQVHIVKNYFDMEDNDIVVKKIISDLKDLIVKLEQLQKESEKERD